MHRFFFVFNFLAHLFKLTLDRTGIQYMCLHEFLPKMIFGGFRFTSTW